MAEDDEVVLIEQGDDAITAEEMAGWAETIAYEVLARLESNIPRQLVSARGRRH